MFELSLSSKRLVALVSAILLALSAGTNYAFSIYSVQLGQRLHLSATAINIIGLAGNWGMYLSSPIVGKLIDRYNPTFPLLITVTLISFGYGSLWFIYSNPSHPVCNSLAIIGNLFIGIGSSTANSCAITGIASVIQPSHRASAIGVVLAGFGLSAFFWTTIGSLIARSDTAVLLALLSIGPALIVILGALGYLIVGLDRKSNSQTRPSQASISKSPAPNSRHEGSEVTRLLPLKDKLNISGWALVKQHDFWMIWITMSCCCGIALMMINNVGTIIAALSRHNDPTRNTHKIVHRLQANAVSILSIFNCVGRIFAGTTSDLLKKRLSIGRVWWLSWISILFMMSQMLGYYVVNDIKNVIWLTGLVGFAYGNIYGIAPALILEWFGLENFATNFGYLNLSPLLSGQIFNLSFGSIFDHHSHRSNDPNEGGLVCEDGKKCYQTAFLITIVGSCIALSLSICLGFRRPEFPQSENYKNPNSSRLNRDVENEERVPILTASSDDE